MTDTAPRPQGLGRRSFLSVLGASGLAVGAGLVVAALPASPASAAGFGFTDDGTRYVIDTGANLVFKVSHVNGDLTSFVYRGVEYQGYQGTNSQVESGLGTSTVSIRQSGSVIVVTVSHGTLLHYYVARSGEPNIYMFTNKADSSVAAGRYIVRVKPGVFPNTGPDGWLTTDTVIEAAHIVRASDGSTHSKHYSGLRAMDYDYVGKTTGSVGLWLVRSNHPGSLPVSAADDEGATFAIVYGPQDEAVDWLRAGEGVSAAWLAAVRHGVSVLPMSATIEVDSTRLALRELLAGRGEPYLVLRFGRAEPDDTGPPRPPRINATQRIERALA